MLSDLSANWHKKVAFSDKVTCCATSCANELDTEIAATHERMKQIFKAFRLDAGHSIRKHWVEKYEQLEQDILQELKGKGAPSTLSKQE